MGNRYGRNQKRRHREEIAALQKAQAEDKVRLSSAVNRAIDLDYEMQAWDEEIRRMLGTYSALRRKTPEMVSNHPIREMPVMQPLPSYADLAGDSDIDMPMSTRERMSRFVFTLRRDDMRMQRLIRFMESDGRGGVAYAISDTALEMGFGKREIDYIAYEIARNLARHWNSQDAKSSS